MSSAQNETFSPRNTAVLGGLLLLAVFLGEVVFNPLDKAGMSKPDTLDDIAMRLKPVVSLGIMRSSANATAADGAAGKSPEQLYQGACKACHDSGAAGAPKLGDEGAWAERVAQGLDALIEAAVKGVGGMPPRGGSQYSDAEMRSAVEYMAAASNAEMRKEIEAAAAEKADDPAAAEGDTAAAEGDTAAAEGGAATESAAGGSPDELYLGACQACHTTGAAGAPKIGDAAAWGERAGKGMDALVSSAINGIGTMPPRGGSQYSDEQIKAVVQYIMDNSK